MDISLINLKYLHMQNYLLLSITILAMASCNFNTPQQSQVKTETELQSVIHPEYQEGVAIEVLQTSNYTYLLLNIDGQEIWIAGPRMEAAKGEKYYFVQNMEMENFQSKELNRIFDKVIFAQEIKSENEEMNQKVQNTQNQTDYKAEIQTTKQDIKISFEKGVISIADLYANKSKYAGKIVTVKGIVTKYNAQIMGKNWIHIQDGTEKDGHFDLVITTELDVSLGDTITLSGKVSLDKDFGYGYQYDVLIEDAVKKKLI